MTLEKRPLRLTDPDSLEWLGPDNAALSAGGNGLSRDSFPPFTSVREKKSPLEVQVGGDHYKKMAIQPFEYLHANQIPFLEGNVIKYVSRWKSKGGIADLEKARHTLDVLIAFERAAKE